MREIIYTRIIFRSRVRDGWSSAATCRPRTANNHVGLASVSLAYLSLPEIGSLRRFQNDAPSLLCETIGGQGDQNVPATGSESAVLLRRNPLECFERPGHSGSGARSRLRHRLGLWGYGSVEPSSPDEFASILGTSRSAGRTGNIAPHCVLSISGVINPLFCD